MISLMGQPSTILQVRKVATTLLFYCDHNKRHLTQSNNTANTERVILCKVLWVPPSAFLGVGRKGEGWRQNTCSGCYELLTNT